MYGAYVKATCSHLDQMAAVGPGKAFCESCLEIGGRWVHLRQCLICGRTGCCDTSPNKHASRHFAETGHPIMRSLEPGEDWIFCFVDQHTMRPDGQGGWLRVDPFFDAGLWYAAEAINAGVRPPFPPDLATADGFPLGSWAATNRRKHRDGSLDPEQEEEIAALPGWTW